MCEDTMLASNKEVDSFRFLDRTSKMMVQSWIKLEAPREVPWTPLRKPLSECRVTIISSAALAMKADQPFDQEGERQNPWWSDPSFRVLPRSATAGDVNLYHLHIHPRVIERDINTLFPVQRLLQLEAWGEIGSSAPHHYSYMGYTLQPETLLQESVPAMIAQMQDEAVDIVLLVPG